MSHKLSWGAYLFNVFLLLVLVLLIVGVAEYVPRISYAILGFLVVVYEAVNSSLKSVATSVGGEGVFAALVFAFIALILAHRAHDKAEDLAKKVEELEEKLVEKEQEEDW
jgi:lipopolysaccharide export LptBFGC system permease protein LptF